ncbi:MAG: hypothetical protein K6F78_04760 [Bacteroidaceae bacterium]|nr:hypothetical protein [Bacteroidaceae bacterium]
MTTFYFNEVLPAQSSKDVVALFGDLVLKAARLIKKFHLSRPIIIEKPSSEISICGMPLSTIIEACPKRDVKNEAYFLFSHSTLQELEKKTLTNDDLDALLATTFEFDGQDAMNLVIAHIMEWPVLSMPLSDSLQKDYLIITSPTEEDIKVVNYYAQDDTAFIEHWISEKETAAYHGLEKLKCLLGIDNVIVTDEFEKEWGTAIKQHQDIVYERFKYAQDNGKLTLGGSDDTTVRKDVVKGTPDVYELKQKGSGIRVYFGYSADGGKIVLAGFSTKARAAGAEQSTDIICAQGRIKRALAAADI